MFSKKSSGDLKKSCQKVIDHRKDAVTRLKHLRIVLDNLQAVDVRSYFEINHSQIYYVFYENFILVEAGLRQKVTKAQREELDNVLYVLERIIVYLPDLIHVRWQFNSIGRILKKLLHVGNCLKVRLDGMRLFLLWFQVLQNNASHECYLIYATLVPNFPPPEELQGTSLEGVMVQGSKVISSSEVPIEEAEIQPIISQQPGEKHPDNLPKVMLESLLRYSVAEVCRMEWDNERRSENSFIFLLTCFKRFYLPTIFPEFSSSTSLYKSIHDIPDLRIHHSLNEKYDGMISSLVAACKVSVIQWVISFITIKKNSKPPKLKHETKVEREEDDEEGQEEGERRDSREDSLERNLDESFKDDGSPNTTLTNMDQSLEMDFQGVPEKELIDIARDMVQKVFYSNRLNVDFVVEVLRQGFLLPMSEASAVRKSLRVYKDWIQCQGHELKPRFMSEPSVQEPSDMGDPPTYSESQLGAKEPAKSDATRIPDFKDTLTLEEGNQLLGVTDVDSPPLPQPDKTFELDDQVEDEAVQRLDSDTTLKKTITTSFSDEINQSLQQELDKCDVEAGLQATMKVFITHSAHVFLSEPPGNEERHIREQVNICEMVLNLYKNIVMTVAMDKDNWEQLLKVLLKITQGVLGGPPTATRLSLGKQLAASLFKTLIITWIKANLKIQVSVELWDDFLHVLSSLTHWEELIKEWAKTMDTLTKVLARRVYGLDLNNLPLDKLEEQRRKRIRGPKTEKLNHQPPKSHARTFSQGWSRTDSISPQEEYKRLRYDVSTLESHPEASTEMDTAGTLKPKDLAKLVQDGSETDLYPTLTRQRSMTVDPGYDEMSLQRSVQLIGDQIGKVKASDNLHSSFPTLMSQRSSIEDPGGGTGPSDNSAVNFQFTRSSSAGDLLEAVSFVKDEPKCETAQKSLPKSTSFPPANQDSSSQTESGQNPPHTLPKSTTFPPDHQSEIPLTVTDAAPLLDDSHSLEVGDLRVLEPPDRISIASSLSVHTADSHLSTSMDSDSITPSAFLEELNQDLSPSSQPLFLQSEASTPSQALSLEGDDGSLQETPLEPQSVEGPEVFHRPELSVISGGTKTGWSTDAAVILWRRMLGALGDINKISNPDHHAQVIKCLWDLWQLLAKLRDNLGISTNNLTTPPPPDYIPPLQLIAPWLFKATELQNTHQNGRLGAYRLLCTLTIRRQDQPLSEEYLTHFYRLLHVGLNNSEQDVVNTIVKYSTPEFFSCDLPGSTMLIRDFIHAANIITNSADMEAPRISALSLLGSLVCFPNMFCNLNLLEPSSTEIKCGKHPDMSTVKDDLLGILIKCGRKEPNSEARCIALCSLSIFLYEELVHATFHSRMKDALNVLLVSLKFSSKQVAQMACDMLVMLSDQAGRLRTHMSETPKKIIEVIAITASSLLPQAHASGDKKLLVSLFFCLLEWCMAVPVTSLLEPTQSNSKQKGELLLHTVFRVLQSAAEEVIHPRWSADLAQLASPDYDPHLNLDAIKESRRSLFLDSSISGPHSFIPGTPSQGRASLSSNVVTLTAKMVLCHLMNRLNHFPLGGGPACFTSKVNEFDDLPNLEMEDLTPAIFEAPNVQFFIHNDSSIVSLVQFPSQDAISDEGGFLASAQSKVRIIVRDVGGKFSWDAGILYGPSDRKMISEKPEEQEVQSINTSGEGGSEENLTRMSSLSHSLSDIHILNRPRSTLPSWDADRDTDLLNELQQFLGYTSPECLLRPGIPLNLPSPAPEEISTPLEKEAVAAIVQQFDMETQFCSENAERKSMISQPVEETTHTEPESGFFLCRTLLSQLGILNWNKRSQVDILKKNNQLARELRNLDSRQCRETHKIAVMYVAEGQEDKMSVLSNSAGSQAYENFVAGIGWEIDLATHTGFMGGLEKNQSTGETTPYWATSSVEVIFHVSTRMPSGPEDHNKKMRHLGNDEVHIIWSEHIRDYRRGIIATEFGDVIIVIYPLKNKLFRIQIQRKADVPFFGPLFDGAIVDHIVLPGLVRATAINASRSKRLQLPCYQRFYEERAQYFETIIKNHKKPSPFEEFAANVFEPSVANKPLTRSKPGHPSHLALQVQSRHGTLQTLPTLKLDIKSQGVSVSLKSSQTHSPSGSVDKAVQPMAPINPGPSSGRNIPSERAASHQTTGSNTNPSNKSTGTGSLEKQSTIRPSSTGTLEKQSTIRPSSKEVDKQVDNSVSGKQTSSSSKSKDKRSPSSGSVTPDLSSSS